MWQKGKRWRQQEAETARDGIYEEVEHVKRARSEIQQESGYQTTKEPSHQAALPNTSRTAYIQEDKRFTRSGEQ